LDLVVAAALPLAGMRDCAGSNHVHIDIDDALSKMAAGFNCCGMAAVFPECAFSALWAADYGCFDRNERTALL